MSTSRAQRRADLEREAQEKLLTPAEREEILDLATTYSVDIIDFRWAATLDLAISGLAEAHMILDDDGGDTDPSEQVMRAWASIGETLEMLVGDAP